MLTLNNFEDEVNGTILQRGRSYFKQHAIIDLEMTSDDTWVAEVEGTDIYQVEVTLKNNDEITEFYCDCPYDGDVCKHVVAVFYELREAV